MAIWRKSLLLISCALISAAGIAQQSEREAERAAEEQQLTVEVQMREAEERLAEAARQIAELSTSNLPAIVEIERRIHMDGRAVLGITIGSSDGDGPAHLYFAGEAALRAGPAGLFLNLMQLFGSRQMAIWRKSLLLISCALISAAGIAQQSEREAERAAEEQQLTVEVQMREAEERLAEAARQIAELSTSNLPAIVEIERRIHMDGRAVLGHPYECGGNNFKSGGPDCGD